MVYKDEVKNMILEVYFMLEHFERDDFKYLCKKLNDLDDSCDGFIGWWLSDIFKKIDINYNEFLFDLSELIVVNCFQFVVKEMLKEV